VRTAEEWQKLWYEKCLTLPSDNANDCVEKASIEFTKKIQSDAHAQGMRDAAEIAGSVYPHQSSTASKQAILAAIKQKERV
jgi:hypothetical protein